MHWIGLSGKGVRESLLERRCIDFRFDLYLIELNLHCNIDKNWTAFNIHCHPVSISLEVRVFMAVCHQLCVIHGD